jgi:hypothetical protein
VREERTKKKKRIDDLREEAVARDEKLKREARVLFFPFYMLMRVSAGRVGYSQGKNLYTRNPPYPHGLDKIQPKSIKKKNSKSRQGGAVRFSSWVGFCPALLTTNF